jgi:hypothetical protein
LFPNKKNEMPVNNLRNLVEDFDALEDPVLQLKLSSVRRGVEGTISLTQSHGENVDWEKVSSDYARRPEEMKEFFVEAKKYAPKLVSLILPTPTPSASAPSSSAPAPMVPLLLRWRRLLLVLLVDSLWCLFCCNQNTVLCCLVQSYFL